MKNNLKKLREDKDVSQEMVADYIGCSQRSYSHFECGDRTISDFALIKLALYFDTSVDYILGLTDEKDPYKRSKGFKK